VSALAAYPRWRRVYVGGIESVTPAACLHWRHVRTGGVSALAAYIHWRHTHPGGVPALTITYILPEPNLPTTLLTGLVQAVVLLLIALTLTSLKYWFL